MLSIHWSFVCSIDWLIYLNIDFISTFIYLVHLFIRCVLAFFFACLTNFPHLPLQKLDVLTHLPFDAVYPYTYTACVLGHLIESWTWNLPQEDLTCTTAQNGCMHMQALFVGVEAHCGHTDLVLVTDINTHTAAPNVCTCTLFSWAQQLTEVPNILSLYLIRSFFLDCMIFWRAWKPP